MLHGAKWKVISKRPGAVMIEDMRGPQLSVANDALRVTRRLNKQFPNERYFYLGCDQCLGEIVHVGPLFVAVVEVQPEIT